MSGWVCGVIMNLISHARPHIVLPTRNHLVWSRPSILESLLPSRTSEEQPYRCSQYQRIKNLMEDFSEFETKIFTQTPKSQISRRKSRFFTLTCLLVAPEPLECF